MPTTNKVYLGDKLVCDSGSGGGTGGFTDSFEVGIIADDSNATPTDEVTFAAELLLEDSNAGQTESVELAVSGSGFNDSIGTPTDETTFKLQYWGNSATGTSNTDNPTNAEGENNGTLAELQTAPAGAAQSDLDVKLGNNISSITFSSAKLVVYFKVASVLATSRLTIDAQSTGGVFTTINCFDEQQTNYTADYTTTPFEFDLYAAGIDTIAKLQSTFFFFRALDAVAGVTPCSMDVDAVSILLDVTL